MNYAFMGMVLGLGTFGLYAMEEPSTAQGPHLKSVYSCPPALVTAIHALKNREALEKQGVIPPRVLILQGAHGTGKEFIANEIAKELTNGPLQDYFVDQDGLQKRCSWVQAPESEKKEWRREPKIFAVPAVQAGDEKLIAPECIHDGALTLPGITKCKMSLQHMFDDVVATARHHNQKIAVVSLHDIDVLHRVFVPARQLSFFLDAEIERAQEQGVHVVVVGRSVTQGCTTGVLKSVRVINMLLPDSKTRKDFLHMFATRMNARIPDQVVNSLQDCIRNKRPRQLLAAVEDAVTNAHAAGSKKDKNNLLVLETEHFNLQDPANPITMPVIDPHTTEFLGDALCEEVPGFARKNSRSLYH